MTLPILVDCDPGQDDALALLLAFGSPNLDVRGITTVGGNCSAEQGARNALGLCRLAGRDVPVFRGLDRVDAFGSHPRSYVHGPTGIEGFDLPDGGEAPDGGVEAMLDVVRANPGLVVCALGPLTNLAEAIRREPGAFAQVGRLAIMGGSTERGNRTPAAEFNIWVDPEAAAFVLESGLPISLIGLNTTYRALLPEDVAARFAAMPNRTGPAVAGLLDCYGRRYRARLGLSRPAVHDVLVLADLADPGVVTFERSNVVVETEGRFTRGATIVDLHAVTGRPANSDVAMNVDTARLWALLEAALRRLP